MTAVQVDTLLAMRLLATRVRCDCYHPDELEYDSAGMCPRCRLIALIDNALEAPEQQ
jgi:hypothetical protein